MQRVECNVSKQLPATLAVACISATANPKGFLGDIRSNDAHQNFFSPLVADEHNEKVKSAKGRV